MLRLERVTKIYPTCEVLRDITWEVKAGDRIGLVGANGAGKSTQLKIIAGLEEPSSGNIFRQGEPIVAYLQQEFDVDINRTVRSELFQAFREAASVLSQMQEVELAMSTKHALNDSHYLNSLINKLGILQSRFEAIHGYELEAQIDKLLPEIGFSTKEADCLVGEFSGGWQMRIALGKILLQKPDLLLLDEPTNHLDIDTIEWLETYLRSQASAMVIISHDRYFLDKICTQIISTNKGISRTYLGNYTNFLEQKELEEISQRSAFDRQQKELSEQQSYIDRFRASATRSTQAKSREKMIQKLEIIEAPLETSVRTNFRFPSPPRSGSKVIFVEDLTKTYDEKIIFLGANLEVKPNDKIAFLGPNGSGKSSLFRLIMGLEQPDDGISSLGPHNIQVGYFAQNQSEVLDLNLTVINTIFNAVPDWSQTQVRSLLGSFSLSKEAVFKEVGKLSGGEKARLALALLIVQPYNLLLLDEPTNHLDIPAKQMLEQALIDFSGTVLMISHDRYFISRVANKIVEIKDGQLILYNGNYEYYLEKKAEEKEKKEIAMDIAKKETKRLEKKKKKRNLNKK